MHARVRSERRRGGEKRDTLDVVRRGREREIAIGTLLRLVPFFLHQICNAVFFLPAKQYGKHAKKTLVEEVKLPLLISLLLLCWNFL